MDSSAASPGWFPQPDGRLRYWDGQEWTEHYHSTGDARQGQRNDPASVTNRVVSTNMGTDHQDIIWNAVARPLSGIGRGHYWLTPYYLFFERGTVSTNSQQVPIASVVDVDVHQSMIQKSRSLYTVSVHIQRSYGIERVFMADIAEGRKAQQIINESAHAARLAIQRNQNRYEYATQEAPLPNPAPAPSTTADGEDRLVKLERLAKLHKEGALTDAEFTELKIQLMSNPTDSRSGSNPAERL